jgi:hypothetical protein
MNPVIKGIWIFFIICNTAGILLTVLAHYTTASAQEKEQEEEERESLVIDIVIFRDGTGLLIYDNSTKFVFKHNFTYPSIPLYENNTIFYNDSNKTVFMQ